MCSLKPEEKNQTSLHIYILEKWTESFNELFKNSFFRNLSTMLLC